MPPPKRKTFNKKKSSNNKKRKFAKRENDGPAAKKPAAKKPAAKKTTPPPPKPAAAATKTTRSATENDRLKEELEKQKQEAQELKQKVLELESGQKHKADQVKLLKAAGEDDNVYMMLKNGLVKDVYNSFKFLFVEEEVEELVAACLEHTTDWPKIKALDGPDMDAVVQSYVDVYGSSICSAMNTARSTDQTQLRNKWLDLQKKGKLATAAMYLKVALRDPDHLLILDENTGDEKVDAENKKKNEDNKKYRDRFNVYISQIVPCCLYKDVWNYGLSGGRLISEVDKATNQELVPAEGEAMSILFLENNEQKWIWQSGVLGAGYSTVTAYKKEVKQLEKAGKKLKEHQIEPEALYSSSTCGANPLGGWSDEGKARYKELVDMIRKARGLDTTPAIEEQARKEIEKEMTISDDEEEEEEEETSEDEEEEDDGGEVDADDEGYTSVDSAAAMKELTKFAWVDPEKKEEEQQEKEGKEQKPEEAAAVKEEGGKNKASAVATKKEDDDDKKEDASDEKEGGSKSGGSAPNTSTSAPPTVDTSSESNTSDKGDTSNKDQSTGGHPEQQKQPPTQQKKAPTSAKGKGLVKGKGKLPTKSQPSRKAKDGNNKQG